MNLSASRLRSRPGPRLITLAAALSITIVRLPFFFEHKSILDPLILGVFVLAIGWGATRQR
jgi:hypothetical protein